MLRVITGLIATVLVLSSNAVIGEETNVEEEWPDISGSIGAGGQVASGNTESESANFDASAEVMYENWRNRARFDGYRASEDGEETAERYSGSLQSNYRFAERSYLFTNARYRSDRFGAFDRRASLSAGLGRRFVDSDYVTLYLEAGLGRSISEPDGGNDREAESIGRFHGEFLWQLTGNSRFRQEVEIESGDSNTASESVSAFRSRLVGELYWRMSHTVIHNSDVPADAENTDSFTTLALKYLF